MSLPFLKIILPLTAPLGNKFWRRPYSLPYVRVYFKLIFSTVSCDLWRYMIRGYIFTLRAYDRILPKYYVTVVFSVRF